MNNKIAYILVLVLIYLIYINYINRETLEMFKTGITEKHIKAINKHIRVLNSHIKDIATISKHNTRSICSMTKAIASASSI